MDSLNLDSRRRKTLDVSRLKSSLQPSRDKRHSWDPSTPSHLSNRSTAEKLALIQESLQALKAENDPLNQNSAAGIRSLTASNRSSSQRSDRNDAPKLNPDSNILLRYQTSSNLCSVKTSKWIHKNDTPELNANWSVDRNAPPRFQRKHYGNREAKKDQKSHPGIATVVLSVLTVLCILGMNYLFVLDFQKGLCERNLTLNMTSLNATLHNQVFGQHIAVETVVSMVYHHMAPMETTPLVLSFLGWTGVGKDFVSSIITDHIRTKRRTVHKLIAPLHFPRDKDETSYFYKIPDWIFHNLSSCAINLVIFDELENASSVVIRGIEEVLKRLHGLGLNSTRIIVILVSNSGGVQINRLLYEHIKAGKSREEITSISVLHALEGTEAQWHLAMQKQGLITEVVPFLPLERKHVARCIEQNVEMKREACANPHVVAQVMDEMSFFPAEDPQLSVAGCRTVGTKVDLVLDLVESGHAHFTNKYTE